MDNVKLIGYFNSDDDDEFYNDATDNYDFAFHKA